MKIEFDESLYKRIEDINDYLVEINAGILDTYGSMDQAIEKDEYIAGIDEDLANINQLLEDLEGNIDNFKDNLHNLEEYLDDLNNEEYEDPYDYIDDLEDIDDEEDIDILDDF